MQIVYLSNRPEVLRETVAAVQRHLQWITEAVVVTPSPATFDLGSLPVTFVADAEVAGVSPAALESMDHVSRNVTLRRGLLRANNDAGKPILADDFILSDDDYRPLVDVPITDFIAADGRHQGYWFYQLERWPGRRTDYDRAQIRTLAVLRLLGCSTLAYGAHMPQVMHRDWLVEAFDIADEFDPGPLIDEWSLYFNVASQQHPENFLPPLPFRTLAWPAWPHQWPHVVDPHPIQFENYYPEHDAPGGLFHRLPKPDSRRGALARVEAWRAAELAIGELHFDPDWIDPWTSGRQRSRLVMDALRSARKLRKYTGLGS